MRDIIKENIYFRRKKNSLCIMLRKLERRVRFLSPRASLEGGKEAFVRGKKVEWNKEGGSQV